MTEIYLFPGEHSCRQGMGEDLFRSFPEKVRQADEILDYSIADLCLRNASGKLQRTLFAGPAVYVVNALALSSKIRIDSPPMLAAGYGVGEYNALLAAKVFDFATGLKLVKRRAELLSEERSGAMLTVVGLSPETVQQTLDEKNFSEVHIAEFTSPKQVVLSGPANHIESAQEWMQEVGAKRVVSLPVTGAFHCAHMLDQAADFGEMLQNCIFNDPAIPVFANCTAKPYTGSLVADCLMRQICSPILWEQTIRALLQKPQPHFAEVGPGRVLSFQLHLIRDAVAAEAEALEEEEAQTNTN